MARFSLGRSERLKSRKLFSEVFQNGTSFRKYPLLLIALPRELHEKNNHLKAGFSISKKAHKSAVHRNLLKRRMREAYRLNKLDISEFCQISGQSFALVFVYTARKAENYNTMERALKYLLKSLFIKFGKVD